MCVCVCVRARVCARVCVLTSSLNLSSFVLHISRAGKPAQQKGWTCVSKDMGHEGYNLVDIKKTALDMPKTAGFKQIGLHRGFKCSG